MNNQVFGAMSLDFGLILMLILTLVAIAIAIAVAIVVVNYTLGCSLCLFHYNDSSLYFSSASNTVITVIIFQIEVISFFLCFLLAPVRFPWFISVVIVAVW